MKQNKNLRAVLLLPILLLCLLACNSKVKESVAATTLTDEQKQQRLEILTQKAIADLSKVPFDSMQIPRTVEDGQFKGTPSRSWTSGFYPGVLWQLYGFSQSDQLKSAAVQWSAVVEKEKMDGGTHDLGFKVYCPFGNAYNITKDDQYKEVYLTASKTLSTRFNPTVGAIRSWDHHADVWQFPVIIDNMMNLEMLFEATKMTGDSSFYDIAYQHALTTLANHFRADNSSYHVISFNPETGEVEKRNTHQGHAHESAWSRGQAWGLYGFTVAYRYTKDQKLLKKAQDIAKFIFNHPNLPADLIPYWDYDAPNIPDAPRDVSAATIAASGLFELSQYDTENAAQYVDWANQILANLESDKYQASTAPFFLQQSVGNMPGDSEVTVPIIYADYYYVEALLRSREHTKL